MITVTEIRSQIRSFLMQRYPSIIPTLGDDDPL